MSYPERQAVKTLAITLLFLLAASTLLFAAAAVQEIEKRFRPDPDRPLLVRVRGDGAEVEIASPERVREGRARYRCDPRHFSGSLVFDAEENLISAGLDMDGLNREDSGDSPSELSVLVPRGQRVALDCSMKAGMVDLDGEGMVFEDLGLKLWAGEMSARFPVVSPGHMKRVVVDVKMGETDLEGLGNLAFRELDVNGFVGEITLDFRGSLRMRRRARVDLEMGSITVCVPAGMAVEARIGKMGFLAEVDIPGGWSSEGKYAFSPTARGQEPDLLLDIRGGIGEIKILER
ncbi:MAG: hypothetical protein R6W82_04535 [bacterium]